MIAGARQGTLSALSRFVSFSMAQDLGVYVVPGVEIMRAHGLDIEDAGMNIVASPRHASVLLVVGDIPSALRDAAAVLYAQMPRPRVLFTLTRSATANLSPLPAADIVAGLSQPQLVKGVAQLRKILVDGAFRSDVSDFDSPVLQVRIEYVCPMHPEVVQDEPGSCPKCGMNLMPREVQATAVHQHSAIAHSVKHDVPVSYTCPMHPEVEQDVPGSCPKCGMDLELRDDNAESKHENDHQHELQQEYTCPMHPEVVQSEPGSCPKCGMSLELREKEADDQPMEHSAVEYTCPMHPEVVQSEPGSCPKCGMNLELREKEAKHQPMDHAAVEYTCPMHPEVVQSEPGSCPKCGMNLEPHEIEAKHNHDHAVEYTCPMHPEIVQDEPGSCPECGMFLEPRERQSKKHDHSMMESAMNHEDSDFMSMVDVTKDLPRSGDGLQMDWIDVPFGPFFPGLPGGLLLTLTLDGDTVAAANVDTLVSKEPLLSHAIASSDFIERLTTLDPLAPMSYRLLACLAIENAADSGVETETSKIRLVALEKERIVSHLNWLALFAQQAGFDWLLYRASSLQKSFMQADINQITNLKKPVLDLSKRLQRTPLLNSCTTDIGRLLTDTGITLWGPVARASGIKNDVRSNDKLYSELGFSLITESGGDAHARLQLRLHEIRQSIELIEKTGLSSDAVINTITVSQKIKIDTVSGDGEAVIETPRGQARLQLTLDKGQVISAQLETPSTQHLELIARLTEQQELGNALLAVSSLDLSPWEIRP